MRTREDWIRAGAVAFREKDLVHFRSSDPEKIRRVRDPKSFDGVYTREDGSLLYQRWVVTASGVQLSMAGCVACHARVMPDGSILWAAAQVQPPGGHRTYLAASTFREWPAFNGDSPGVAAWRQYTTPWEPDPRVEAFRDATEAQLREVRGERGEPRSESTAARFTLPRFRIYKR
jgi:hypothetical protein